ncbi:hypothetical protein LCGC14_2141110 [marine sediment metagenome]|uniref:Uncharacterized protein n=1 Tax=marine sediment metagenome TaxID=412755 RepID=A0A0F9EKN8_9ZZZZ
MKKVRALVYFEYSGKEIHPGFNIWMHDLDLSQYEGRIKVLDIPENRQMK